MFPQDADSPIWIPDRLIQAANIKTATTKTKAKKKINGSEAAEALVDAQENNNMDTTKTPDKKSREIGEGSAKA